MASAVFIFLALSVLCAGFVAGGWVTAYRLAPVGGEEPRRWLLSWSIKGVLVPLALWALMNVGLSWGLQPFMPQVQMAQYRGASWFPQFLIVTADGAFIVSSCWSAVTLGWVLVRVGGALEPQARTSLKALCWTCFLGLVVPALIIAWIGGWPAFGLAALTILAPAAGLAPGGLNPKKSPPMYARAIARIKFGKYTEAEWEIIRELEKHEDDFDGWMMIAELYANQFGNVAEAEQTVLEICDQPKTTPTQLSIALHRLADWHLKVTEDPEPARRALQMICDRLSGTHLAHMAKLRMNQLPANAGQLREQRKAKPIPLPAARPAFQLRIVPDPSALDHEQSLDLANAYVEKLKREPNNISTREKLARVLAERLNEADQAIEQMSMLLDLPDQPEAKRAEWIAVAADWHIRYRQDFEEGQRLLERLVCEFPQSIQAQTARRRLANPKSKGL